MFDIAEIQIEEIVRIEKMWEKLIQANGENSPYFSDYYATFEFKIRCGFLKEKIDSGSRVRTFLLIDTEKGEDIGFATSSYNSESSFGEIEMLYVSDEYRGQGLGKKLFGHSLDTLKGEGIKDIKLCVTFGNDAAIRLYKTFGFYPFTVDCLYKG